jgi:hypothetical protein
MSTNVFYADLDEINGKGVFITGHGKSLINRNSIINGKYIANDMVRLIVKCGELLGYQGYTAFLGNEKEDNELTKIDYLLYFFAQSELNQPSEPTSIDTDTYLRLSKHNIELDDSMIAAFNSLVGKHSQNLKNAYEEYEELLKQLSNACFIAVPFTADENQRASFINDIII